MDLRSSLFELENWSPKLAQFLWQWVPRLDSPVLAASLFKIQNIDDMHIALKIHNNRWNRDSKGRMGPMLLIASAEYASRLLWQRHMQPNLDELSLVELQSHFNRNAMGSIMVKFELNPAERENVMQEVRLGRSAVHEMVGTFVDEAQQAVGAVHLKWQLHSLGQQALNEGRKK